MASQLGSWIKQRRQDQGFSQSELADRAGLSRSYVCDIERGRGSRPSLATLDKLSAALEATREEILVAGGLLEPSQQRGNDSERRLLAIYRDLTPEGRSNLERFARFSHGEEYRWRQLRLIEDQDPGGQESNQIVHDERQFRLDET